MTIARTKNYADGDTLTASDYMAELDNIITNGLVPAQIDDESTNATAMRATADPYPSSAESLATTLQGEFQRLRYVIKQITNQAYWYHDPNSVAFHVHKNTTAQTSCVGAGTATVLTWSTETLDSQTNFATNTFTPTVAGTYMFIGSADLSAGVEDASIYALNINKNGSVIFRGPYVVAKGTGEHGIYVSGIAIANGSTDYFTISVYNAGTADVTISGVAAVTYFMGFRVGP